MPDFLDVTQESVYNGQIEMAIVITDWVCVYGRTSGRDLRHAEAFSENSYNCVSVRLPCSADCCSDTVRFCCCC